MKKNILLSVLFLTALILAEGCRKERVISNKQLVLFQYDYLRKSDSLQHSGFFIDNNGNILEYDNPREWNHGNHLSEEQLIKNIQSCKQTGKKIPEEELHKYRNLIVNLASSKITAKRKVSSGEGTARFICLQYSESRNAYISHIIKMEGDTTCENLNFYSKKVASWMREAGL
jgi:hypothetical protein